jgi:hypothetical protein
MTPQSLLLTAALLGLYVLFGGAYGTCYAAGKIQEWRSCGRFAPAFYALQLAVMLIIAFATPLGLGWKILIGLSTVVYAVIPGITLRYLRGLHAG